MNVGVVGNARYPGLKELFHDVYQTAHKLGFVLHAEPDLQGLWPVPVPLMGEVALDALITFGGDGTLLRGARMLGGARIPVMGVNLGRVGFLTSADRHTIHEALAALATEDYVVEDRKVLEAVVINEEGEKEPLPAALNDLVIHKSGVARLIRLRVSVDDIDVGTYSADGLIIATPTGSTAYSLSAGGPIIVPGVDAIVITPICAHTLAVRPVVIPASAVVRIRPIEAVYESILISLDGQKATTLVPGHEVEVRRGPGEVCLARLSEADYFRRMRQTLHWGDLSDRGDPP